MSNLQETIDQIQSELTVDAQGKGYATIRGVARLAGVEHSSLVRAFQGAALKPSKLTEILGVQGFEGGALEAWAETGVPDVAIATILEYYAMDAGRYCTAQARLACKAFTRVGIRAWMRQLKGWQQPQEDLDPLTTQLKACLELRQRQLESERKISEVEQRMQQLESIRLEAQKELLALPPTSANVPIESTDMKIRRVVNSHSAATGIKQQDIYRQLYQQFYYRYHRNVQPLEKESKLQAFIRLGLIDCLYDLALDMLVVKLSPQTEQSNVVSLTR